MKRANGLALIFAAMGLVAGGSFVSCTNADPKLIPPEHVQPPTEPPQETEKGSVRTLSSPVDILFVIDDSGSMLSHQRNLSKNVGNFVAEFFKAGVTDYQIGVITTSTSYCDSWSGNCWYTWGDGKLMGSPSFITASTPDGLNILSRKMLVGTSGNGEEMIFTPIKLAFSEPNLSGLNAGFLRPDAHLAIVIITDTEDQSKINAKDIHNFLLDLKPNHPDKILTYAAMIPTKYTIPCPRDDGNPTRIEEFMSLTNGQTFGICDADFGAKIAAMGADLARRTMRYLMFSRKPVESSIRVRWGTQEILRDPDTGWTYDPDRIALRFGPKLVWSKQPPGTQVEVDFKPIDVLPNQSK